MGEHAETRRQVARPEPRVSRGMMPNSMARSYLYRHSGPFTLKWDEHDWCSVFEGRKKVWECNGTFGRLHFYATNNASLASGCAAPAENSDGKR